MYPSFDWSSSPYLFAAPRLPSLLPVFEARAAIVIPSTAESWCAVTMCSCRIVRGREKTKSIERDGDDAAVEDQVGKYHRLHKTGLPLLKKDSSMSGEKKGKTAKIRTVVMPLLLLSLFATFHLPICLKIALPAVKSDRDTHWAPLSLAAA
ncbi:hypothetical protein R3P38DRAFT_3298792 [Favolaschia claudopus]|uniref:Uncharacterized protein n=1 Tax=Favolaschia claudopus TaxID=2862362 RepID=A0AAV9Z2B4_9AGAR